jgi:3-dehydroquinate dehydratase-2
MAKLLLINGPNFNLLGKREPGVCGDVKAEHVIVDRVQDLRQDGAAYIPINPRAFTHQHHHSGRATRSRHSVHRNSPAQRVRRKTFRHSNYFSNIAEGCIFGLGAFGYELALQAASMRLSEEP